MDPQFDVLRKSDMWRELLSGMGKYDETLGSLSTPI
jgi:hypothetical protein